MDVDLRDYKGDSDIEVRGVGTTDYHHPATERPGHTSYSSAHRSPARDLDERLVVGSLLLLSLLDEGDAGVRRPSERRTRTTGRAAGR